MTNIAEVLKKNMEESLSILKTQPNQTITFAVWNEWDMCYYPNDGKVHTDWYDTIDNCPWVTIYDEDGNLKEGIVTEVRYNAHNGLIEFTKTSSPDLQTDSVWYDITSTQGITYWGVLAAIGRWAAENNGQKVYVVVQESCVDGDIITNATPCATIEAARKVVADEIETICKESPAYEGLDINNPSDKWLVDRSGDNIFIKVECDDYYEYFKIDEKTLIS